MGQSIEFEGIELSKHMTKEEFEQRVKASYGFLSGREPELNHAEYALFEKFIPYLEVDPEFALSMVEGLTKNNDSLTASFDYTLGSLYVELGNLEQAELSYKNAIEKYPDYLRSWKALGFMYMDGEDYDNALNVLTKAIQLGDTDPMTFGQIGFCFYLKGEFLSSLSAYSQAVLYEPSNVEWMYGKVASLKALNDFQQANVILRDMVRRNPESAPYWMELANNWIRLQQPLKAAACLEYLRSGDLQTRASMEILGTLYLNEALNEQAYDVYLSMIEGDIMPHDSTLLRCALKLHIGGMEKEAENLVSLYLEASPELSPLAEMAILRYQSSVLEKSEKYAEAKELIEKCLELKPDDSGAMVALGRLEYQLGNTSRALIVLEQAERFSKVASEAAVIQAQIMVASRDYKGAERKLENALVNGGDVWVERYYDEVKLMRRKAELDKLAGSPF